MAIVKAESLSAFHQFTVQNTINTAALKAVIQGDDNCFSAAIFSGNLDAFEYLMHLGKQFSFDINRKDIIIGTTLLHDAARVGNYEIIKFLLENGADRDIKNFQSETPLFFATRLNHTRCVKLLVYVDERMRMTRKLGARGKNKYASPTPQKKQMIGNLRSLDEKVRGVLSLKNHRGRTAKEIASLGSMVADGGEVVWKNGKKTKSKGKSKTRPTSAPAIRHRNPVLISLLDANEVVKGSFGTPGKKLAMSGGRPRTAPGGGGSAVRGRVRPKTAGGVRKAGGGNLGGKAPPRRPNTAKMSRGKRQGEGGFSTPIKRSERPMTAH